MHATTIKERKRLAKEKIIDLVHDEKEKQLEIEINKLVNVLCVLCVVWFNEILVLTGSLQPSNSQNKKGGTIAPIFQCMISLPTQVMPA